MDHLDAATDQLEAKLQHWRGLGELQIEFLQALGIYKLDTAKAELVTAVAAGQWAVAHTKARVVRELDAALSRLRRLRGRYERRAERITRQTRDLAKIRSGEWLELRQATRMWAAYTVFQRLAPISVLESLINTELHPSARLAESYVDLRQPNAPCQPPPASVDNVHALLNWIRQRGYMPRQGSESYRQIVAGVAQIAAVAEMEINSLQEALQQMEQGTYDTWKPLALAALPDSIDVNKIIKLGSR